MSFASFLRYVARREAGLKDTNPTFGEVEALWLEEQQRREETEAQVRRLKFDLESSHLEAEQLRTERDNALRGRQRLLDRREAERRRAELASAAMHRAAETVSETANLILSDRAALVQKHGTVARLERAIDAIRDADLQLKGSSKPGSPGGGT
ncbi:MAG: hypothetical protein AAGB93_00700 [Planctomycetota bacterium]